MTQLSGVLAVALVLVPFSVVQAQSAGMAFRVRSADPAMTSVSLISSSSARHPGVGRATEPVSVTADTIEIGPVAPGQGYRMLTTSVRSDGDVITFAVPARLILEEQPLDFVLRAAPGAVALTVEAISESKNASALVVASATGTSIRITRGTASGAVTIAAERITSKRP
jgi:hypothetical protein